MENSQFSIKKILIFIISILLMVAFTIFNKIYKENLNYNVKLVSIEDINKLNKIINSGDISKVDYDFVYNDIYLIDEYTKEMLAKVETQNKNVVDREKLISYYKQCDIIFTNKINEIVYILNQKLNDEDYFNLLTELDTFNKDIDFAIDEIKNTIESTIEAELYSYKYMYEQKKQKCYDLVNNYKGFLNYKNH